VALTNNPHGVTAAQVGAYTEAEFDYLVAEGTSLVAVAAALDNHTNNVANPHADTIALLGGVTNVDFLAHAVDTNNPHGLVWSDVPGAVSSLALMAHTNDYDNPHDVGVGQLVGGAVSQAVFSVHTTTTGLAAHHEMLSQVGCPGASSMVIGRYAFSYNSGVSPVVRLTVPIGRAMTSTNYLVFVTMSEKQGSYYYPIDGLRLRTVSRGLSSFDIVFKGSALFAESWTAHWCVVVP
jgi:hypothetical protein